MKFFIAASGCLFVLYLAFTGGLFFLMLQPPPVFAKTVAKVPDPVLFLLMPFRWLWLLARQGDLKVGDEAPDFCLQTTDKKAAVKLSAFRGQKPVVLVFGSYT